MATGFDPETKQWRFAVSSTDPAVPFHGDVLYSIADASDIGAAYYAVEIAQGGRVMIYITTRECGWYREKLGSALDATGHSLECESQPYAIFRNRLINNLQDTHMKLVPSIVDISQYVTTPYGMKTERSRVRELLQFSPMMSSAGITAEGKDTKTLISMESRANAVPSTI